MHVSAAASSPQPRAFRCGTAQFSLRRLFDFRRVSQRCEPRDSSHLANCPEFLSQPLGCRTFRSGFADDSSSLLRHHTETSNSGLNQNRSGGTDRAPQSATFPNCSHRASGKSSGDRGPTKPGLHERRRTVLRVDWPVRHFCVSQVGPVAVRRKIRPGKHTRRQTLAGGSSQTENRRRSAWKTKREGLGQVGSHQPESVQMQREPAFGRLEKRDPTIGHGRAYALSSQNIKLLEFDRNTDFVRRNTATRRDGPRSA